ncbi:MAG: hypothetical protein ABIL11_00080, partial [Chloroflexota bacterium]
GQGDLGDGSGAVDRLTWLDLADGDFAFGCEVGQEGADPSTGSGQRFIFAPVLGWHFWWKRMSRLPALAQVQVIQSTPKAYSVGLFGAVGVVPPSRPSARGCYAMPGA